MRNHFGINGLSRRYYTVADYEQLIEIWKLIISNRRNEEYMVFVSIIEGLAEHFPGLVLLLKC